MDGKLADPGPVEDQHRGQTLAEFAITLPILLLLLFGLVEFGRLFQSWVTLQNAARAAARYTTTGQYNEDKYDLETLLPCVSDTPVLTKDFVTVPIYDFNPDDGASAYYDLMWWEQSSPVEADKDEELYVNWYGRADCQVNDTSLQQRKDILRVMSIYDEARRGAAGLRLDEPLTGGYNATRQDVENYMRDMWASPSPRLDDPGWFRVVVCSAAERLYGDTDTDIVNNPDDPTNESLRYYTHEQSLMDPYQVTHYNPSGPRWEHNNSFPAGACLIKERPDDPADPVMLDIYDRPNNDAGGAGERITIIVTYNHPLITPLGFARYIQLQARRSAINESFKISKAPPVEVPENGPGNPLDPPTATPAPDTDTPEPSTTPLPTETPTPTEGDPPTPTPQPFECDKLRADFAYFEGTAVTVRLYNDNVKETFLEKTILNWRPDILGQAQPDAYVGFQTIEGAVYWMGDINETNVQASGATPIDSSDTTKGTDYAFEREERILEADANILWKATWLGVSGQLSSYMHASELAGTQFYMNNPDGGSCIVDLDVPEQVLPTSPPEDFTPSPTYTPDCADARLTLSFVRFDRLGDVRLRVENRRTIPSEFTGFELVWPDQTGIRLVKMVVGGANANDVADPFNNPNGQGVIVWQNLSGGDADSTTNSSNGGDGVWNTNFIFPPNSVTDVHLDFTGVGSSTLDSIGIHPSQFNGSSFRIYCGLAPEGQGGSGPGNNPFGDIQFDAVPPPEPTDIPPPTPTRGPTLTPTDTATPGPPTQTWTPRPPTETFTPSPTLQATDTLAPTATPTDFTIGGGDG